MIDIYNPSEFDKLNSTTIHCDTKDSRDGLTKIITEIMDGKVDDLDYVHNDTINLQVWDNDYYDRKKIDPEDLDTYTYFPYRIEIGPKDEKVERKVFIEEVRRLLKELKAEGFRPALSADFEDEIPGY